MTTAKERSAVAPAIYARLAALLAERAEQLGYAIGVHGSLSRDLDLIAVPWTDTAVDVSALIESLRECCGGYILADGTPAARFDPESKAWIEKPIKSPEAKPHGRLAWSINLGGGAYIDLSVMPKVPNGS